MERETRFELATPALARRCSTAELFPHVCNPGFLSCDCSFIIPKNLDGCQHIFNKYFFVKQHMITSSYQHIILLYFQYIGQP